MQLNNNVVQITSANAESCDKALHSLRAHLELLALRTKTYPVECIFGEYRFVFTSREDITSLIAVLTNKLAAYRAARDRNHVALVTNLRAKEGETMGKAMIVRCNWCLDILEEPGALVFTPPDAAGQCNKIHVCVRCYARVIHPGPSVVAGAHPAVSGRLRVPRSDPNAPTCECGSRGTLHVSGCTSADATRPQ